MKITLEINDKYAEQVMNAWVAELENLPMAHLDTRTKDEKFKETITRIILTKWDNYRTNEIAKEAIVNEPKITEQVLSIS